MGDRRQVPPAARCHWSAAAAAPLMPRQHRKIWRVLNSLPHHPPPDPFCVQSELRTPLHPLAPCPPSLFSSPQPQAVSWGSVSQVPLRIDRLEAQTSKQARWSALASMGEPTRVPTLGHSAGACIEAIRVPTFPSNCIDNCDWPALQLSLETVCQAEGTPAGAVPALRMRRQLGLQGLPQPNAPIALVHFVQHN